jgi:competence protein ComEC
MAHSRAPLALAAASFAGGIWLAGHLDRPVALWGWSAVLLAICAIAGAAKGAQWPARAAALLALVSAGALAGVATPVPVNVVPSPEFFSGERVEIVAHVTNDGALLAGGGPRERFDLETESITLGERRFVQPVGIRVTAFWRQDEGDKAGQTGDLPHLNYGDRLRLLARLRMPRNFRNPGAFDYEGYLRGQGISTLASAKATDIEVLPGKSGGRLGFWRSHLRRSIVEHIREQGLWSREDAALFAAMIVGDDSLLLRDVREEFQQTGVYHLLVVSGMNVALLAFTVFWLARRLRLPDWTASLVTVALSVFYAYIAGMGVPIVRAVLMLTVFLAARLLYRNRSSLNATGFAALAVLVLSPAALFEAGFQLTFLALLAITGISLPLLERSSAPYRNALRHLDSTAIDLGLPPKVAQFRLDLRLVAGRLARFAGATPARIMTISAAAAFLTLYELVVVSATTQAVLVVPMRMYFHRAAILGLPANVLVLPFAGIMLNAGVAAIALSYVFLPLARVVAGLAALMLHWTLVCLNSLSHLHLAQWRVPEPSGLVTIAAGAGVLVALVAVRQSRRTMVAGTALLFISSGIAAGYLDTPKTKPGILEITAIDVGQGDSLLVISPAGKTMLIDGGGSIGPVRSEFDYGEDVVAPYLWWRGLERLDVVALTHAHGDHIGGLERIIQDFRPAELWVGINPPTAALQRLYDTAGRNQVAIRTHTAGEALDWAGSRIRVLSPPADWHPKAKHENDDSLVLQIRYGDTSALLAGDLEKQMERFVATESPQSDLLKVAHHGSATSTTPELLAAVHPHFAVISVGHGNSFGHPRREVLERLQEHRVLTYRTDFFGAVTFLLDGKQARAQVGPH